MNICDYPNQKTIKKKINCSYKCKTWIHTLRRVYTLNYTYKYMSSYTIIEFL